MANNVVGVPHPNGSYSYAAGTTFQRGAVPTAAQPKGTQFYDTQTDTLYLSDGAAWIPVTSAPTFNGAVLTIRFDVTFANFAGTVSSMTSILAGSVVLRSTVNVTAAFDGGATLNLGNTPTPALLQTGGGVDNDLSVIGIYTPGIDQDTDWGGLTLPATATLQGLGPFTVGAARITVEYAMPNP